MLWLVPFSLSSQGLEITAFPGDPKFLAQALYQIPVTNGRE